MSDDSLGVRDDALDLLDWKRQVSALYADVRSAVDPEPAWTRWREGREELFAAHPQSPLPPEARASFDGLRYFDYDPAARVVATVERTTGETRALPSSGAGPMTFRRIGVASFELAGTEQRLDLHWLEAYGGGLFVPVADATSGTETYGGGRYVLDTVKGADLGTSEGGLVLDFNFAYNPSCTDDPRWLRPLAPPGNRLTIPVPAGERGPVAEG